MIFKSALVTDGKKSAYANRLGRNCCGTGFSHIHTHANQIAE